MDALNDYRERIDNLDAALIGILAERFKITREIGLHKAREALPARDLGREEAQMARVEALAQQAGLRPGVARSVLRVVIDHVLEDHQAIRQSLAAAPRGARD